MHYGDMYRARAEESLIRAHLPSWASSESHRVQVELAKGYKAQAELSKLRDALRVIKRAVRESSI